MWWSSFAARPEKPCVSAFRGAREAHRGACREVEERRHGRPHRRRRPAESDEPLREVRTFVSYDFSFCRGKSHSRNLGQIRFSLVMLGKMLTGKFPGAIFPDR